MLEDNNKPQQTVSQFCYNLATVLDAAIIERNKELIETAMQHGNQYRELLQKILNFAGKLEARHKAMGEGADNVLEKYTSFFGIQKELAAQEALNPAEL